MSNFFQWKLHSTIIIWLLAKRPTFVPFYLFFLYVFSSISIQDVIRFDLFVSFSLLLYHKVQSNWALNQYTLKPGNVMERYALQVMHFYHILLSLRFHVFFVCSFFLRFHRKWILKSRDFESISIASRDNVSQTKLFS